MNTKSFKRDLDEQLLQYYEYLELGDVEEQTQVINNLLKLICEYNSSFNSFITDCKNLVRKLERQSFNIAALRKRFEIFVDKYFNIWGKFGINLTSEHVF